MRVVVDRVFRCNVGMVGFYCCCVGERVIS